MLLSPSNRRLHHVCPQTPPSKKSITHPSKFQLTLKFEMFNFTLANKIDLTRFSYTAYWLTLPTSYKFFSAHHDQHQRSSNDLKLVISCMYLVCCAGYFFFTDLLRNKINLSVSFSRHDRTKIHIKFLNCLSI